MTEALLKNNKMNRIVRLQKSHTQTRKVQIVSNIVQLEKSVQVQLLLVLGKQVISRRFFINMHVSCSPLSGMIRWTRS